MHFDISQTSDVASQTVLPAYALGPSLSLWSEQSISLLERVFAPAPPQRSALATRQVVALTNAQGVVDAVAFASSAADRVGSDRTPQLNGPPRRSPQYIVRIKQAKKPTALYDSLAQMMAADLYFDGVCSHKFIDGTLNMRGYSIHFLRRRLKRYFVDEDFILAQRDSDTMERAAAQRSVGTEVFERALRDGAAPTSTPSLGPSAPST